MSRLRGRFRLPNPRTLMFMSAAAIFFVALLGVRPPWENSGSFINFGLIIMALAFITRGDENEE